MIVIVQTALLLARMAVTWGSVSATLPRRTAEHGYELFSRSYIIVLLVLLVVAASLAVWRWKWLHELLTTRARWKFILFVLPAVLLLLLPLVSDARTAGHIWDGRASLGFIIGEPLIAVSFVLGQFIQFFHTDGNDTALKMQQKLSDAARAEQRVVEAMSDGLLEIVTLKANRLRSILKEHRGKSSIGMKQLWKALRPDQQILAMLILIEKTVSGAISGAPRSLVALFQAENNYIRPIAAWKSGVLATDMMNARFETEKSRFQMQHALTPDSAIEAAAAVEQTEKCCCVASSGIRKGDGFWSVSPSGTDKPFCVLCIPLAVGKGQAAERYVLALTIDAEKDLKQLAAQNDALKYVLKHAQERLLFELAMRRIWPETKNASIANIER